MFTRLTTLALMFAALVLASPTPALAGQDQPAKLPAGLVVPPPEVTQELQLLDGTVFQGRIERIEGTRVFFRTVADVLVDADVSQVKSVKQVTGRTVGGTFLANDPNPTRLFFGPTGRSLPRGTGYVGVYEAVLPFVQVGVTDHISLGGGTPLFFGGDSAHPLWFTPKVQVLSLKSTQAAVGVMHFFNIDDGNFGVAYGAVTQGTADTAVTVAAGYAYETSSADDIENPGVLMIGLEHRVSRRTKLISENYFFSGAGLASFGVRFLGEHLSADLALVVPLGADEAIAFPMVNFVWTFGSR